MKLFIINGPNLNVLGNRQPQYYGHMSFDTFLDNLKKKYKKIHFEYRQSNREGDIINFIQENWMTSRRSNYNWLYII